MLIRALAVPKSQLTTVSENCTLEEALHILEESGYRCVPILDETGSIFRGNIYKMHIYRHKANGLDMKLPVTYLLKNATKFIRTDSSFFKVFFTIKELPYIAVLDASNKFYGILTHSRMLSMLQSSWNVDNASFVLSILSSGDKGELVNICKIVNKYSNIASCITLDSAENSRTIRRAIITLPPDVDEELLDNIVKALEKKEYSVSEIEDLRN